MVKTGDVTTLTIEDIAVDKAERLYPHDNRLALKEYYRVLEKYSKTDNNKVDKIAMLNKVYLELNKNLLKYNKKAGDFELGVTDDELKLLEELIKIKNEIRINKIKADEEIEGDNNVIKPAKNKQEHIKQVTTITIEVKDLLGI